MVHLRKEKIDKFHLNYPWQIFFLLLFRSIKGYNIDDASYFQEVLRWLIYFFIKQNYCDLFIFLYTRDAVGKQSLCPHDVWVSQGSQSLYADSDKKEVQEVLWRHPLVWESRDVFLEEVTFRIEVLYPPLHSPVNYQAGLFFFFQSGIRSTILKREIFWLRIVIYRNLDKHLLTQKILHTFKNIMLSSLFQVISLC